jgi:hypothetical protein
MRQLLFSAALLAGLFALAPSGQAQTEFGLSDNPFNQYFGYYVPRQQAMAAQLQRGTVASINVNAADRRASALAGRGTFAPQAFSPFDTRFQDQNPFDPRRPLHPPTILIPGQPSPMPHPGYYNRTSNYYFNRPSGSPTSRR